jgi:hypothetical protein
MKCYFREEAKGAKRHGWKILSRLRGGGTGAPRRALRRARGPCRHSAWPGLPALSRPTVGALSLSRLLFLRQVSMGAQRASEDLAKMAGPGRGAGGSSWPGEGTQRSRALPRRPTRFPGEDSPWEGENLRKVDTLVLLAGSRGLRWRMCGKPALSLLCTVAEATSWAMGGRVPSRLWPRGEEGTRPDFAAGFGLNTRFGTATDLCGEPGLSVPRLTSEARPTVAAPAG